MRKQRRNVFVPSGAFLPAQNLSSSYLSFLFGMSKFHTDTVLSVHRYTTTNAQGNELEKKATSSTTCPVKEYDANLMFEDGGTNPKGRRWISYVTPDMCDVLLNVELTMKEEAACIEVGFCVHQDTCTLLRQERDALSDVKVNSTKKSILSPVFSLRPHPPSRDLHVDLLKMCMPLCMFRDYGGGVFICITSSQQQETHNPILNAVASVQIITPGHKIPPFYSDSYYVGDNGVAMKNIITTITISRNRSISERRNTPVSAEHFHDRRSVEHAIDDGIYYETNDMSSDSGDDE